MSTSIIVKTEVPALTLSGAVDTRIEDGWRALQKRDARVFNGTLLRVLGKVDENSPVVNVAHDIGYREVVGLRSYPDFLDWVSMDEQFQVLSCIAFVETSDGAVLLRERSTGDWGHSMELIGGFITAGAVPDSVEEFIVGQVAKDLDVAVDVITLVEKIGHVDFISICESMYVTKVKLNLAFADLPQEQFAFFTIPEDYTPDNHQSFFSLPLHPPTKTVLEQYLETALKSTSLLTT